MSATNISLLPIEILNLILVYYTNDFRGLARFSTICRQWKIIADFSEIWLICDLDFYSSNSYFNLFPLSPLLTENEIRQKKIELGDENPFVIDLWSNFVRFPSAKFKIVIQRSLAHSLIRNPLNTGNTPQSILRADQAFEIRTKFMGLFSEFQRLWAWQVYWLPIVRFVNRVFKLKDYIFYTLLATIIGLLCLGISCYLLSSITNYSNHLTTENHAGFALLECTFLYYSLTIVHCIAFRICSHFIHATDLNFRISDDDSLLPMYLLLLVIISAGLSLPLLHYKLGSQNSSFLFIYILFPVWVMMVPIGTIAYWISKSYRDAREKFIRNYLLLILFLLSLPVGFTMLALYYDFPGFLSNLLVTMIPFYPWLMITASVTLYSVIDNYKEARNLAQNKRQKPRAWWYTKLCFALMRSLTCIGLVILEISFILVVTQNQFSLSYGFLFCLVWIILFQLTVANQLVTMSL